METALLGVIATLIGILGTTVTLLVRAVVRGDLVAGVHFRELMRINADLRRDLARTGETAKAAAKSRGTG